MANPLFDSLYTGLERVLDLRSQQHGLTATNLANADTPGFHAQYIDFNDVLGQVMDDQGGGLQMQRSNGGHLPVAGEAALGEVIEVEPPPWSENDNSVYSEREMARMNANSLMYSGVSRGLSRRLAMLKFVASDGR